MFKLIIPFINRSTLLKKEKSLKKRVWTLGSLSVKIFQIIFQYKPQKNEDISLQTEEKDSYYRKHKNLHNLFSLNVCKIKNSNTYWGKVLEDDKIYC